MIVVLGRSSDPLIRAASLSNLAEFCHLLQHAIAPVIYEVCGPGWRMHYFHFGGNAFACAISYDNDWLLTCHIEKARSSIAKFDHFDDGWRLAFSEFVTTSFPCDSVSVNFRFTIAAFSPRMCCLMWGIPFLLHSCVIRVIEKGTSSVAKTIIPLICSH